MDIDIQFKGGINKLFSADWVGREHDLLVVRVNNDGVRYRTSFPIEAVECVTTSELLPTEPR